MKPPSQISHHLLPLLRDSGHVRQMVPTDWEATIRLARDAGLLGVIACRLRSREEWWSAVPEAPRGHLLSAIHFSDYRVQQVCQLLRALAGSWPEATPVVLLKGAAYIVQGIPVAQGRMPSDADFLVPRADLAASEAALLAAGWRMQLLSPYDERYYREWSHELPPMRHADYSLELDLHHTITPVTSRVRADDRLLFADTVPLADSRYQVLAPADQIIHAAIHLFQDSDLCGQLRNLVDLDALCRFHLDDEAAWTALAERATRHGAGRLLWYALAYCRAWLATPVPEGLALEVPPAMARAALDWVFRRSCPPRIPDQRSSPGEWLAARLGLLRYHCLRMPPGLLLRHLASKAGANLFASKPG